MLRFKSFTNSPQRVLFPALLLIAAFGAACGGGKPNSTSDSAPASSALGGPAFEGEITAKMFAGSQPMDIRYATKGSRMRAEMRLSPGSPQMDAVLMDFTAGTQTMLFAQNKSYMTMDVSKMAGEMAQEAGKDPSAAFPKVTPTDKTETIAGITCQHWLMGDKQDTDVCMAKGLGYFAGGGGGGILDQLKNLAMRDKIKAQLDANPEFAKFVEGGAFPLKVSHIENGQSRTIMEVTSVERKSLDDSLFTIPADYKKMEIPGMPGAKQ